MRSIYLLESSYENYDCILDRRFSDVLMIRIDKKTLEYCRESLRAIGIYFELDKRYRT
jgi:hypothetical protein